MAGESNRGDEGVLSRRLDHIAIGAARHDAVLHLAGCGQIAREPDSDRKQDNGDQKAGDGAAAVIALVGIRFGHRTVACQNGRGLGASPATVLT
jgi:hypothetical protein